MTTQFTHADLVRRAIPIIAVSMAVYHLWAIAFGSPEAIWFRGMHLLFALVLTFLIYRQTGATEGKPTLLDYTLLVLGAAPILYLFANYKHVVTRIYYIDDLTALEMALGAILVVVVLEATRRLIGWALPITAIVFLFYGFGIARLEPMLMLDQLYMTTEGIFGIPLSVSAAYVLIFVLFGSFMERTGTGQLFMDFAMGLTGHTAGGPGKVSVVSSSLFGTISGSAVANVMVDGPISIPLMKRAGFPPHFAAGVEATASTGGQIMPPIMGAAAFVMAEFIGVAYAQVVIWALIPAILYYIACFGAVHFEAKRRGLVGLRRSELPPLGKTLTERGHLFIPVLAILAVLYSGYSAPMAALAGTILCFPVAWFGPSVLFAVPLLQLAPLVVPIPSYVPNVLGLHPLLEAGIAAAIVGFWVWSVRDRIILLRPKFWDIVEAMADGARNALAVALACASAGIIIGVVTLSGLGIVFTQFVVNLAAHTLLVALILTMLAGIVLGMGMPTTPSYIIMTALLVPALIKLGVVEPAAHMFAFYFAILSAITPPVALAVYAAAGLAKSDLWSSGWAAVKIGAAGFIVPFMFAYEPALLMIGDWPLIVTAFCTASIGILLFAAGLHGYFIARTTLWQSAFLVMSGLLLVKPGLATDIMGAIFAVSIAANQLVAGRAGDEMAANRINIRVALGLSGLVAGLIVGVLTRPFSVGGDVPLETLFTILESPTAQTWPAIQGSVIHIALFGIGCCLLGLVLSYVVGLNARNRVTPSR